MGFTVVLIFFGGPFILKLTPTTPSPVFFPTKISPTSGIFAINELPDLAGKIQVGLFNLLEEGDVQVKGYPIRMPLDVLMVFTANPEDYTARGKIITPLKDRIGAEILTHYPNEVETGIDITRQEAWVARDGISVVIPDFVEESVERIAFLARDDRRIDERSGLANACQ